MKSVKRLCVSFGFAAAALGLTFPVAASAAEAPPKPTESSRPKPAAVPDEPATTTATYGDWTLLCQRVSQGDTVTKLCEVAETIQIQGQNGPIARFAIARSPSKALRAAIVLPTNISLPSLVHVGGDDPKDASLDLTWSRCLPGGCYAEAALPDEVLAAWRASAKPRTLSFAAANGRSVALPLSLRGLPQALDALAKL